MLYEISPCIKDEVCENEINLNYIYNKPFNTIHMNYDQINITAIWSELCDIKFGGKSPFCPLESNTLDHNESQLFII
jgi:hypothetical protein